MRKPEKVLKSLINLRNDLSRMAQDEDYDIFDDWEIEEMHSLIWDTIEHVKGLVK